MEQELTKEEQIRVVYEIVLGVLTDNFRRFMQGGSYGIKRGIITAEVKHTLMPATDLEIDASNLEDLVTLALERGCAEQKFFSSMPGVYCSALKAEVERRELEATPGCDLAIITYTRRN